MKKQTLSKVADVVGGLGLLIGIIMGYYMGVL